MKIRAAAILISLCLFTVAHAQEETTSVMNQIAIKLARGAVNFATGWVEVPKQIYL
ncbi:MAG: exosortase system-associated protein, TIGR04073 family, partial [Nitrospiraceae bacterium]